MSGHQTATIGDTVFFWFAANDTSGSGGDGATPLFDVREAGAAASAIPLLSGTPDLLTHVGFPPGCFEIAVAATGGNGFAADDTFAVFCTLAIDSQNPTGFVGSCTLTPLAKDGTVLKPTVAGRTLDVTAAGEGGIDLDNAVGSISASQFDQGAADKVWSTAARILTANTNLNDVSAADVNAQCDLALSDINLDHWVGTASGIPALPAGTYLDLLQDDGTATYSRTTDSLQAIRDQGDSAWTTGAGGSDRLLMVDTAITSLTSQTEFIIDAGSPDDDAYNNCTIVFEDVATATQKAIGVVNNYTGGTRTVFLKEAPIFTLVATDKVYILAENALKSTVVNRFLDVNATGEAGIDLDNTSGTLDAAQIGTGAITAAKFASNAITSAVLANDAITNAVFANDAIDASVIANGAIDAATFAAGAIDAAAIADDAGAKLRNSISGTADSGSVSTMVDNALTQADTDYFKGSWIKFTSGNIDGQARLITGFTPASDTVTFSPDVTQAVATQGYEIIPAVDMWARVLGNTTNSASALMQIAAGVAAAKISGMATTTVTIRDIEDAANMIVATVDSDGNRSAITLTPPVD